jgi:uncharacterized protein YukE
VKDVAFKLYHRDSTLFARQGCSSLVEKPNPVSSGYAGDMARMFVQQSQGYIQQIEEEIERLQHLIEQVRATIHNEELESRDTKRSVSRKLTVNKTAPKKKAAAR